MKSARERGGLTQAKLAEDAGITDETVSRLERGAYEPLRRFLRLLAPDSRRIVTRLIDVLESKDRARPRR